MHVSKLTLQSAGYRPVPRNHFGIPVPPPPAAPCPPAAVSLLASSLSSVGGRSIGAVSNAQRLRHRTRGDQLVKRDWHKLHHYGMVARAAHLGLLRLHQRVGDGSVWTKVLASAELTERREPIVRRLDAPKRLLARRAEAWHAAQLPLDQVKPRRVLRRCHKVVVVTLDTSVIVRVAARGAVARVRPPASLNRLMGGDRPHGFVSNSSSSCAA